MNSYEQQILSSLLDKYERSSFFHEQKQPTRRIMLKLYDNGKIDFPQYNIEDYDTHQQINQAVISLQKGGYIDFKWMKGEDEHIIAEVWLNMGRMSDAYTQVKRKPKSVEIEAICAELLSALEQTTSTWGRAYLQATYKQVQHRKKITNNLPTEPQERHDLLHTIIFVSNLAQAEVLERVFSMQCLGDSKRFEKNVKKRLIRILTKYLDLDEEMTDEALLRQIGIIKYPEQFEFCGPITIEIADTGLDFSMLHYGATITSGDLRRGTLDISPNVTRIISIENRANYIDYLAHHRDARELVLFHGGQYSPAKREFLLAVAKACPSACHWYHWGDIDYGGFSMLARLRREIKADIAPYRMNLAELEIHRERTASIMADYITKLQSLKKHLELEDCCSCIDYMIHKKIKLEQEAMLINNDYMQI